MTHNFLLFLIFIFGGALGSFANVVADRLYIRSFWTGRSVCDACAKSLSWYEMIPVFSFLFLRGRCSKCKVRYGSKHFWVELIGGILALLTYNSYLVNYFSYSVNNNLFIGISLAILFAILFIVFTVIFLYDLRHKLVPSSFAFILIIIGLAFESYKAFNYMNYYGGMTNLFWLDLFSGFLIAAPFYFIYLFSGKRALGLGDILVFFGVGYLAGFIFGISIFLLSVWIGAIVSVLLLYLYPKKYNRKSHIPFAPFIIFATILVLLLKIDILGIIPFLI